MITPGRRARDHELLDALDAYQREPFTGSVWRVVREGRDPLQGYAPSGRWDPATFDVLYTSLEKDGALAEIHFHLSRQPVFPSKIKSVLHRIRVSAEKTLRIANLVALERLGVEKDRYADLLYSRTQEIGDAALFLRFDGVIVPSARWNCANLVLFTDKIAPEALSVEHSEAVDWDIFRRTARLFDR